MKDPRLDEDYKEEQYDFLLGWTVANNNHEKPKKGITKHQKRIAEQLGLDTEKARIRRSRRKSIERHALSIEAINAASPERGDPLI